MSLNLTLIGQMITFLLFVTFTKLYVWPPIFKTLKERQAKIADGLAAAERGRQELARAHEERDQQLKAMQVSASEMVNEAKQQAASLIEAARHQAKLEAARILQQGQVDVTQLKKEALDDLNQQVTTLALVAAEKIMGKSVDLAVHQNLIDELVQQVERA